MKAHSLFDRLSAKNLKGLMATHFSKNYHLSPKAAETLCNDTLVFRELFNPATRQEGQIIHYAPKIGESAAKSIRECELIPVKLTLVDSKDLEVRKKKGLNSLTIEIIKRIARESFVQGALLTLEDISHILHISIRTLKRYKKKIDADGEFFPLRGTYTDMGPGTSHKKRIISLFLLGYTETEIAQRARHSLIRVEAYIKDFLRTILLYEDNYHPAAIVRTTKLSKKLVLEYVKLYKEFSQDSFFEEPLKRVLELYKLQRRFKEKKGALL